MYRVYATIACCLLLASTAARAEAAAPLKVATYGNYMPLHGVASDGSITGLEADLARAIGVHLGREVVFVHTRREHEKGTIEAVAEGLVDLGLNAVTPTAERKEKVDFAGPYVVLRYRLAGRRGVLEKDLATLSARVAVWSDLTEAAARDALPKAELVRVPGQRKAMAMLRKGEVAFVAGEDVGLVATVVPTGYLLSEARFGKSPIGMVVPKGSQAKWDEVLKAIEPQSLALFERWRPGKRPIPMWHWDPVENDFQAVPPELRYPECRVLETRHRAGRGNNESRQRFTYRDRRVTSRHLMGNRDNERQDVYDAQGEIIETMKLERSHTGQPLGKPNYWRWTITPEWDDARRIVGATYAFAHDSGYSKTKLATAYTLHRDPLYRVVAVTLPHPSDRCKGKKTHTLTYGKGGRLDSVVETITGDCSDADADGEWSWNDDYRVRHAFVYDEKGQLIRLEESSEGTNESGKIDPVVKPRIRLKWNATGQLESLDYGPGTAKQQFEYDRMGRLVRHTTFGGSNVETFEYDPDC